MNKVFQICLLLVWSCVALMAQKPAPTAPSINIEIPEKWKNESVIILNQTLSFGYYKPLSGICNEMIDKTLKLNDKAALQTFSEFYFFESDQDEAHRKKVTKQGKDNAYVKITVIKPTGARIKVNLDDAIKVENGDDVPKLFRCEGFYNLYTSPKIPNNYYTYIPVSNYYRKIAIPNLSVGDILEYHAEIDYKANNLPGEALGFPAFHKPLAAKYPILKQEINFMLADGFYVNMNTLHGAPAFKTILSGMDRSGDISKNITTYQIIDENRDKIPATMMSSPVTYLPTAKFQVIIKSRDATVAYGSVFTGSPNKPYTAVSPDDVAQEFNRSFRDAFSSRDISALAKYRKKYSLDTKPFEEKVKHLYSYVKGEVYGYATPSNKSEYYKQFSTFIRPMFNFYFAVYMSKCFTQMGIKHEILAVMPRNDGKIKDLLVAEEATWVVKAEQDGKTMYLYNPNNYMTSDENGDTYLYGGEAYAFTPSTKRDSSYNATARKVVVPAPDPSVSTWHATLKANFDDQLEKLNVNRTVATTGALKTSRTPYACIGIDVSAIYRKKCCYYPAEDIAKYIDNPKRLGRTEQRQRDKDLAELEVVKKELLEKQKEYMKKELEDDYDDIDSYDTFQTIAPGITEDSSTLVYNEQFKLNNMIAKAGRNYTIEIGKMLSKEPKLDDDDLKPRETDIEISFPRTLINEVELTLPEGYTIEDVKDLNFTVDNNLMHYEVVSTLAAGKLSVKATKIYKVVSAPKTEFPKIIDVFQKVYDFSQKKIVLKKG